MSSTARLASRAERAALKPNTLGVRAGDLEPDTVVITLKQHILIESQGKHQRVVRGIVGRHLV